MTTDTPTRATTGAVSAPAILAGLWPLLALVVPVTVAAVLLAGYSPVMARVVSDALIKLIMVVGLYIFIGNSGILSFGHGVFMIVAAYASAWFTMTPQFKKIILPDLPETLQALQLHPLAGAVGAVTIAGLVAVVVGAPLMRLAGIAASIATFAFFNVVVVIYNNWTGWTKGTASLVGLPVYAGPWLCLTMAISAMAVAYVFQLSKHGILLRATREDAVAARAAGVSVEKTRLIGFVVSALVVAVGGLLQGHFNGALTTTSNVYLSLTFLTLAMLVIGGMRSLAGAVVGVAIVATLSEVLRQMERGVEVLGVEFATPSGFGQVALGIAMLGFLVFRPDGVMGGREIGLPLALRRRLPEAGALGKGEHDAD